MSEETPKTKPARRGFPRWARALIKLVIVAGAIVGLALVGAMPKPDHEVPPTETPPVNVVVMDVATEPAVPDTFTLPAVVEPNRVITVAAEVSARIERIVPEEGDPISTGDLLVQLNDDLLDPEFRGAEAQYRRDQIEFERMEALVREDAAPQQDLDNATVQLAASEARLASVRAQLERTKISAPAGGVLNKLLVEEGEYVQPGVPVAEIVDMNLVKVTVDVPERDVGFFAVGEEAEVLIGGGMKKAQTLTGTITYINRLADSMTRSTAMEISLDNRDQRLRSGQIVRVSLRRRVLKDAILIPLRAVLPQEEGYAVYVAVDGTAERRDVGIGMIQGERVEITDGLEAGQKLIIDGHRLVAPGQAITIVSEER